MEAVKQQCDCSSCVLMRWRKRKLYAKKTKKPFNEPKPPERRAHGGKPCPCSFCTKMRGVSDRNRERMRQERQTKRRSSPVRGDDMDARALEMLQREGYR